jgi:hypothetical protein
MAIARGRNQKSGGKAAFICQRVEDNAFHPSKVDRLLPKTIARESAEGARLTFANCVSVTEKKTPPSGWPGQVRRSTEFLLSLKITNVLAFVL